MSDNTTRRIRVFVEGAVSGKKADGAPTIGPLDAYFTKQPPTADRPGSWEAVIEMSADAPAVQDDATWQALKNEHQVRLRLLDGRVASGLIMDDATEQALHATPRTITILGSGAPPFVL